MGQLARLRHDDAESPAVDAAVPLAVGLAADRAVEADVGGDDVAVVVHPLPPGVDVFQQPALVLLVVREHVGVERQRRRLQVLRMIADNVVVILEVRQHLLVAVSP